MCTTALSKASQKLFSVQGTLQGLETSAARFQSFKSRTRAPAIAAAQALRAAVGNGCQNAVDALRESLELCVSPDSEPVRSLHTVRSRTFFFVLAGAAGNGRWFKRFYFLQINWKLKYGR